MAQNPELIVRIPIKGKILVQFDGSDQHHVVGEFSQQIPIKFVSSSDDTIEFRFNEGEAK